MILLDTSVWIDHLRAGDDQVALLLNEGRVLCHPFVIGEIALGHLRRRKEILSDLADLPHAKSATDNEVLNFIEQFGLAGKGIGYIDAHLLAAATLTGGVALWTGDKKLAAIAASLDLAPKF